MRPTITAATHLSAGDRARKGARKLGVSSDVGAIELAEGAAVIDMTKHAESATSEETGQRFTSEEIAEVLRAADPDAYISEQESGWFVIDGRFNLKVASEMLSRMLDMRPA